MAQYPDFLTSTRLGYADGLKGPHCRHDFFPRFEWQTPIYSEEQLKEQAERDAKVTPYKWKDARGVEHERDFTRRQALDRQREMERQIKRQRQLAAGYKAGGNIDEYRATKARITAMRAEYSRFSATMDIKEDWSRVYVDGLGRI